MLKRLFSKVTPVRNTGRDYTLNSGERQTGRTLPDIRYDHRERYKYIGEYLSTRCSFPEKMFGLDVFCANGYGTFMLSEALRCPVLGLDASKEAVTFAERHYCNARTYYANKIFPFQLPPDLFHFVACIESLEHVEDDRLLIREISQALRNGGYLFISTPNETCYSHLKNPDKFHYRHYTRKELVSLVEETSNLKIINWLGQNSYEMQDGKILLHLAEEKMHLTEKVEGQFILYVFKKSAFDQ
jgi:2-polyprenyl-3-methyl-5-hydroxy-6-metoxy-1,4-benzoquinol methylase